MSAENVIELDQPTKALGASLQNIKRAFSGNPAPTAAERIDRLNRLHNGLLDYKDRFIEALNEDFAGRSSAETLMAEIVPILEGIRYNKKHLRSWMKPSKRGKPPYLMGSSVKVHYQPLGVVGIVVPWNFPVFLGLSPLSGALAAGNLAMLKTSEFAPRTGEVMKEMIASNFADDEILVVTGGVDVATEFTKLPFDHLVFTGSTNVGRIVMRAAAENLTPVTLELGGKSPAIIHESYPMDEAAKRIAFGKGMNAGQVCISPDYVMAPSDKVDVFAEEFAKAISSSYPTLKDNPDYTAIISDNQRQRLVDNVKDAESKGAEVTVVDPAGEDFENTRKLPMHIVRNVSDNMRIMQEEIFGPILPIIAYDKVEEAVAYVNGRDRPLALYYFDNNPSRAEKVLSQTHSGGACINDVMSHVAVDDMPFGGVGPSGMGHYHGKEGFLTFSNQRGVVHKGKLNAGAMIGPPWANRIFESFIAFQFRRFKKIE
ncbi:MAG: coniferyl aldehyde dehydrogenase [Pseudomonadota bacterium]